MRRVRLAMRALLGRVMVDQRVVEIEEEKRLHDGRVRRPPGATSS